MNKISQFLRQIRANAINYHALLGISIFVLVWFYNDEIWLRVGEFIDSQSQGAFLKYSMFVAIFLLIWLMAELLCVRIYHRFAQVSRKSHANLIKTYTHTLA